eukprot:jgi/Chlat1/4500/Chrsp29S04576
MAGGEVVYSEPLREIVGEGRNGKYVAACTDLYLGEQGIEKLRGFERLGSIQTFKFLEVLDASNNCLKGLDKLMGALEPCKRSLRELCLGGNPICEEEGYRAALLARFPRLTVLDHHAVTEAERTNAIRLTASQDASEPSNSNSATNNTTTTATTKSAKTKLQRVSAIATKADRRAAAERERAEREDRRVADEWREKLKWPLPRPVEGFWPKEPEELSSQQSATRDEARDARPRKDVLRLFYYPSAGEGASSVRGLKQEAICI